MSVLADMEINPHFEYSAAVCCNIYITTCKILCLLIMKQICFTTCVKKKKRFQRQVWIFQKASVKSLQCERYLFEQKILKTRSNKEHLKEIKITFIRDSWRVYLLKNIYSQKQNTGTNKRVYLHVQLPARISEYISKSLYDIISSRFHL